MPVRDHRWRPYDGPLRGDRARLFVIPRYAVRSALSSRIVTGLLLLAGVAIPLFFSILIYLHHNTPALARLQIDPRTLLPIDARFFHVFLRVEAIAAFLLSLLIGPPLLADDMGKNGIALILARPVTRWQYVLGKAAVPAVLLSLVTWVPGLVLFGFQSSLAGGRWLIGNAELAAAIVVGSAACIAVYGLIVMTLSALARRRLLAGLGFLAVFGVSRAVSQLVELFVAPRLAAMLSPGRLLESLWHGLFGLGATADVNPWAALGLLSAVSAGLLFVIRANVRAYEVSR